MLILRAMPHADISTLFSKRHTTALLRLLRRLCCHADAAMATIMPAHDAAAYHAGTRRRRYACPKSSEREREHMRDGALSV